ncbi:Shedu anti-phage system protein SduA domain-containing protein [Streptomyces mirabilis]|uniref:Shedu anti-phage system protein SduA domain-containing protein n=1 Tax=Streptomyces mirabilis TaxID=68239 RepID=UPI00369BD534
MDDWDAYALSVHEQLTATGFVHVCKWAGHFDPDSFTKYEEVLSAAEDEKPIQKFLEENPWMLIQQMGGSCRWIRPQVRLGDAYVPDFLVARLDSYRLNWTLVELESPRAPLFMASEKNANRPAEKLREGLDQITEWRRWLRANTDYAQRPRGAGKEGLGLVEIGDWANGLVVIGRRSEMTTAQRRTRDQLVFESRTDIHTYDWLTDEGRRVRGHVDELGDGTCEECSMFL